MLQPLNISGGQRFSMDVGLMKYGLLDSEYDDEDEIPKPLNKSQRVSSCEKKVSFLTLDRHDTTEEDPLSSEFTGISYIE